MSSFLFTTRKINDVNDVNCYLKYRGPDSTNVKIINGHSFIHNLLKIGNVPEQPHVDGDVVCMFSGKIYNNHTYKNDVDYILSLYKEHGIKYSNFLDGEFAIGIVDYKKQSVFLSVDTLKLKPMYYSLDGGIGFSSCYTPLEKVGHNQINWMYPNRTMRFSLSDFQLKEECQLYTFDYVERKDCTHDWLFTFKECLTKRVDENFCMGLSSGYDSGIIYSLLAKNNIKFTTYTHVGMQNLEIIKDRLLLAGKQITSKLIYEDVSVLKEIAGNKMKLDNLEFIKRYIHNTFVVKKFDCEIVYQDAKTILSIIETIKSKVDLSGTIKDFKKMELYNLLTLDDGGVLNQGRIACAAHDDDFKIYISGMGNDGVMSSADGLYDAAKFKKDLYPVMPITGQLLHSEWGFVARPHFAKRHITEHENQFGSMGIQVRYPFLDKKVIQEYLWLTKRLQTKYKVPIKEYFDTEKFPYYDGEKHGMSVPLWNNNIEIFYKK
jgi:hypothetical protein